MMSVPGFSSDDRGTSLVELMLCVLILQGVLFAVFSLFRSHLKLMHSTARALEIEEKMTALRLALKPGVDAARSVLAVRTFVLHPSNSLYDQLGRPLIAAARLGDLNPENSALSFLVLDPARYLLPAAAAPGVFCAPAGALPARQSSAAPYLALTPQGQSEIMFELHRANAAACPGQAAFTGEISAPRRLVFRSAGVETALPLPPVPKTQALIALIGIRDAYTIYLDGMHNLRRVSLIAEEDQPLAYGIDRLHVRLATDGLGGKRIAVAARFERAQEQAIYFTLPPDGVHVLDAAA